MSLFPKICGKSDQAGGNCDWPWKFTRFNNELHRYMPKKGNDVLEFDGLTTGSHDGNKQPVSSFRVLRGPVVLLGFHTRYLLLLYEVDVKMSWSTLRTTSVGAILSQFFLQWLIDHHFVCLTHNWELLLDFFSPLSFEADPKLLEIGGLHHTSHFGSFVEIEYCFQRSRELWQMFHGRRPGIPYSRACVEGPSSSTSRKIRFCETRR